MRGVFNIVFRLTMIKRKAERKCVTKNFEKRQRKGALTLFLYILFFLLVSKSVKGKIKRIREVYIKILIFTAL